MPIFLQRRGKVGYWRQLLGIHRSQRILDLLVLKQIQIGTETIDKKFNCKQLNNINNCPIIENALMNFFSLCQYLGQGTRILPNNSKLKFCHNPLPSPPPPLLNTSLQLQHTKKITPLKYPISNIINLLYHSPS